MSRAGSTAPTASGGSPPTFGPRPGSRADRVRPPAYDLRSTSAERTVPDQGYGPASSLPGTGVASQPGLVVAADGTRTASWHDGGRGFFPQAAARGGEG